MQLDKVNNGYLVTTKTEGQFVFEHFYQLWDFLEKKLNPKEVVPPAPQIPSTPVSAEEVAGDVAF